MYLKDFKNVGRLCLDCKSNIISTANKEQKKWVFLIGEEKKKSQKSVSEEGTVQSLDKNPLTSKVKVKPNHGSSEASMEMRTVRGFGFLLSRKKRDKEGKRGATRI